MTITNKNIALSVLSGFMLMGLIGNSLIANVMEPTSKKLDLSAFKNLSNNLTYISQKNSNNELPERLKIEEFAIAGISRRLETEIANNQIRKSRISVVEKRNIVAKTKETEFQLSDEVKLAFSGLKKQSQKIDVETIEEFETAIPDLNNEIKETTFNSEKIASINMQLLENLKDTYYVEKIEESKPVELTSTKVEEDDDLVVFDYSEKADVKEKKFDKKLYERPISNAVRSVIEREINNNPVKVAPISKMAVKPEIKNEVIENTISRIDAKNESTEYSNEESEDQIVYEYSKPVAAPKETKVANNFLASEASKPVEISIKAIEVSNKINLGIGFEFEPDYDRNERLYDNNSGKITLGFNSNESQNETSGVVFKQGFIPTRVDLVNENYEILIPLFSEENFEKKYLIDSNNRNSILIARSEGVEDIEIDSEYSNKLLLDNKFNIVKSNPAFVMFTSVKTGNVLVKYNHFGSTAQKIIYVGEGELYYQNPKFVDGERESFELTTKNLLANNEKNLDVLNRDLKVFNTNTYSKKQALNVYELMMPKQVLGNRKYLELKSQENDIFIGVDKSGKIQIPNKDYVGKVLESFKTVDLTDRCLIQFNFSSPVSDFKVAGKNRSGEMYTELLVLDQDGNLVADDYSSVDKIFILGEQEGQVSIHAESESGSIINAKSFCSNGTYLIEQF